MSKKIIVYGKDFNCLELYGEFFHQHGFNAVTISNAKSLLEYFQDNNTDMIVSDADVLLYENEEVLDKLKDKVDKIPILYLSDKEKSEILKKVLKIKHERVIEKPVTFVKLLQSVHREMQN